MSTSQTIYESAHRGDFDLIRNKLEEEPKLLLQPDDCKRILLHWACVGGSLKLVSYLVDLGSPVDPQDDTETTPLVLASSAGHLAVVRLLIQHGAGVNQKTNTGHSSLQYAASKGWLEICIELVENKADINIIDNRCATPLHRAASKGNLEIVRFFLSFHDRIKVDAKDIYGNTPLHLACEEDRQEEAKLLILNGGNLETRNSEHKTPLDLCTVRLYKILTNKS